MSAVVCVAPPLPFAGRPSEAVREDVGMAAVRHIESLAPRRPQLMPCTGDPLGLQERCLRGCWWGNGE